MKRCVLAGVLAALACQGDHRNLERQPDPHEGGRPQTATRPRRLAPDVAKVYAVPIDGDPVDGPADAKVTLIKAYDYACPFCEKSRPTIEALRKHYGNDLRVVYKQYVVHPQVATVDALAACAADRQGQFLAFDRIVWEQGFGRGQYDKDPEDGRCWDDAEGCPVALGFAGQLGLDLERFKNDMKRACQAQVERDMRDVSRFAVVGTPAFFINGRFMQGAQPLDQFTKLVDEELQRANAAIAAGTPASRYYQTAVLDRGLAQVENPTP